MGNSSLKKGKPGRMFSHTDYSKDKFRLEGLCVTPATILDVLIQRIFTLERTKTIQTTATPESVTGGAGSDKNKPTKQDHKMELCIERFEAWLFSQPPERVIEARSTDSCFLCSFVKETTNLSPVFYWAQWSPQPTKRLEIPEWAMKLIDLKWTRTVSIGGRDSTTVAVMQRRYIELFGDPQVQQKSKSISTPVCA